MKTKLVNIIVLTIMIFSISGCALLDNNVNSLKGSITGNTYECQFYSNDGEKFMTAEGTNIDINSNVVRELTYVDGSWGYTKNLSSVITITIDGSQMESCGSTVLFVEKGLTPDVDFKLKDIQSKADGIGDYQRSAITCLSNR